MRIWARGIKTYLIIAAYVGMSTFTSILIIILHNCTKNTKLGMRHGAAFYNKRKDVCKDSKYIPAKIAAMLRDTSRKLKLEPALKRAALVVQERDVLKSFQFLLS